MSSRLRIRHPTVIHETVDGEVVVVNLETGTYYSLVGTGAWIWSELERMTPPRSIVAALREHYAADPQVEPAAAAFLGHLEREGLIGPDDEHRMSESPLPQADPSNAAPLPAAFEPPRLEAFTDMQELILLDPVHEVDEARGWPHARTAGDRRADAGFRRDRDPSR